MTTETETKPVEQTEEKKEEVKEEVKKEEAETNNAEEKADDKAEKADKEKKEEKKDVKAKKEPAAPKPAVHKQDFEKDVVYLYQFTRTPVLPSLSPYCLKVETWLRLAGLRYEVRGTPCVCMCVFSCMYVCLPRGRFVCPATDAATRLPRTDAASVSPCVRIAFRRPIVQFSVTSLRKPFHTLKTPHSSQKL